MTDQALIAYLAAMENMTVEQFFTDRKDGLKAVDNLRIFYASAYLAKKGAETWTEKSFLLTQTGSIL